MFSDRIGLSKLCTNRADRQTVHPVAQVTRSIPHDDQIHFSDCIRTENCLYDLSNRTDREAFSFFSDRISLSNRTDREAVFSDRISLSILDMIGVSE